MEIHNNKRAFEVFPLAQGPPSKQMQREVAEEPSTILIGGYVIVNFEFFGSFLKKKKQSIYSPRYHLKRLVETAIVL